MAYVDASCRRAAPTPEARPPQASDPRIAPTLLATSGLRGASGPTRASAPRSSARRTRGSSPAGAAISTTSRCPGLLHLALVRSPHAHARVARHRRGARRARSTACVAVLRSPSSRSCAGSVPPLVPEPKRRPYQHPVLAGRARAPRRRGGRGRRRRPTRIAPRMARRRSWSTTGRSPRRHDVDGALAAGAPRVHDDWPGQPVCDDASGVGDVGARLRGRRGRRGRSSTYPRVAGTPIEPRGVMAPPDPRRAA